jgi:hypothetical protein
MPALPVLCSPGISGAPRVCVWNGRCRTSANESTGTLTERSGFGMAGRGAPPSVARARPELPASFSFEAMCRHHGTYFAASTKGDGVLGRRRESLLLRAHDLGCFAYLSLPAGRIEAEAALRGGRSRQSGRNVRLCPHFSTGFKDTCHSVMALCLLTLHVRVMSALACTCAGGFAVPSASSGYRRCMGGIPVIYSLAGKPSVCPLSELALRPRTSVLVHLHAFHYL